MTYHQLLQPREHKRHALNMLPKIKGTGKA